MHPFILTRRIWKDDYDGQMIFGELMGLNLPAICLKGEEKPRKNPHTGNLSRSEIEPGSAAWQARMLPPASQRWTCLFINLYIIYYVIMIILLISVLWEMNVTSLSMSFLLYWLLALACPSIQKGNNQRFYYSIHNWKPCIDQFIARYDYIR